MDTHTSIQDTKLQTGRGGLVTLSFHCLQCVEEVGELSKPEQRTLLPRASRIVDVVHDGLTHAAAKPPLFNI